MKQKSECLVILSGVNVRMVCDGQLGSVNDTASMIIMPVSSSVS